MTYKEKIKKIEDIIIRYGQTDGGHHKAWVLDQIMRTIKKEKYEDFVKEYEYTNDEGNPTEEKEYQWETGIAP